MKHSILIALFVALVGLAASAAPGDIVELSFLGMQTACGTRQTTYRYSVRVSAGQDLAAVAFGLPSGTPLLRRPYMTDGRDASTGLTGVRWDLPAHASADGRSAEVEIVVNDVWTTGPISIEGPAALVAPRVSTSEPESISWNMTIRDFNSHPDFEHYMGAETGIVEKRLGMDGTPTYAGSIFHPKKTVFDRVSFYDWYHDTLANKRFELPMTANRVKNSKPAIYQYDNPAFFPIDNMGYGNNYMHHNFGFTMMISTLFTYRGGETFSFRGDDDVWVFINRQLCIDLGGVHTAMEGNVSLDTLGLKVNETYPLNLFFAERHTCESSFRMSTSLRLEDCARDTCGLCVGSCEADTDGDEIRDCVDPDPLNPSYVCGDGVCSKLESCSVCPQDCTGVKCECPNLNHVEAQHLKDPPTHEVTLSGNFSDDINLYIALPQMLPHRWNVRAAFINPTTFETTQVGLPMQEDPCRYTHRSTRRLPDLIRTAQPRIIEDTDRYRLQFLVRVWCNERFTLANGESYDRNSTFDLSFEVVLFRRVEVRSTVDTLDATLVWGYIEKFSVMVPLDRSQPTVEFDLITVAVEQDYAIDPALFVVRGTAGNLQEVSKPALLGTVDSQPNRQRWHLRATISKYSICSTNANDRFTLDYVIRSLRPHSAAHSSSLTASLEGLENWCMLNTTLRLNGVQSTFANAAAASETIRFFLGDVVHVRDHVFTDLALEKTDLLKVVLSGKALVGSTEFVLYDASSPLYTPLGFSLEQCPPSADKTWVCYRFSLDNKHFNVDKDLRIVSTLRADLNKHPTRRTDASVSATTARVTSTLALGRLDTTGSASAPLVGLAAAAVAICALF
eukprot:m51a1_g14672 hypothetical protein (845) ;mRNA; r:38539-41367